MVGYQNKEVEGDSNFNFVVPTFNMVDSKQTMKLKDIKVQYKELDPTLQYIWTLDLGGATKKHYFYVTEEVAADWGYKPEEYGEVVGWWGDSDCAEDPANEVEIPYGQGFAFVAKDSSTKLVFSGAVQPKEATVDIVGDSIFNFSGNCIPANYVLGDLALIFNGVDPTLQYIWTLDIGGMTKKHYFYVNEAVAADWGYKPEEYGEVVGWWGDSDCAEDPANDIPMNAGQGVAVISKEASQLWIPSPLN